MGGHPGWEPLEWKHQGPSSFFPYFTRRKGKALGSWSGKNLRRSFKKRIESKRLFYTSVSILLSCIQGYRYHLSKFHIYAFSSVQFSSVAQSCPTLCDPINRSTPGLPVHHQPTEFTHTHSHWVSEAIQPFHPLSSPSPPSPNPSQHQGLSQWVNSSHEVAKVLEFQLQRQSFQWMLRTDFFEDWLVWSPNNSRDSQKSYPAPQFESISSFVLSCPYGPASHWYMTTGKTIALTVWTFVSKVISLIFNTLSRFVIAFLPRSTHLLISWLQSLLIVKENEVWEPEK